MKKLAAATVVLTLMSGIAMATPPQWVQQFPTTGQIPYGGIDFTMDNEMNDAMHQAKSEMNSGVSAATALAAVPDNGAKYLGGALGRYGSGKALSIAGGMNHNQYGLRVGLTYDDSHTVGAAVGGSIKF